MILNLSIFGETYATLTVGIEILLFLHAVFKIKKTILVFLLDNLLILFNVVFLLQKSRS